MPDNSNIKLIIAGCLDHNQAAERRLFELFYGYVRSVCVRYAKQKQEAEEMLNDTFYTAFRYLDRYDPAYDFKPWIRKVCVNCCLQHLKKYDSKLELVDVEQVETVERTEVNVGDVEGSELLQMIKKLPPAYRIVFNLYVMEEYKHSEIADLLKISIGASKSNLSRAKAKLQELIGANRLANSKKGKAHG